ncbi:NAD-dependent succinate-semialdehyde dehydrogenase [Terrihabitans rhizophilus]|uniref:NAD-dependent succinate-semialdehyde dehydrogenase n=1 Tax=Terrihabitans rhizophilus TaxID=3092662 RepID=A0ABU4RL30_9HYPH|nr:NAD-dependent succinate-semialdehyde dehydrogenase [Terrihabitans sp. PJ23]MDX6805536.1 NAD-dependent succinate-semialdehyde dehydrogenase [Terrihabitans sp. PJ23]
MFSSINPADGQQIASYEPHGEAEVGRVLDEAVAAQAKWRAEPMEQRCAALTRVGAALREGRDKFAHLISTEMGKPLAEARAEIEKSAWCCNFYAENAQRFLADETVEASAADSRIVYDPLGVVLAIMPWNYPYWQFFRFFAPAIAAGNGVVLKHASNVSGCALAIEQLVHGAGVPSALSRSLLIESKRVAGLIADRRIAAVTLTGSTAVGQLVAAEAGRHIKKQVLELGGTDPFIVLADADIARAAEFAARSRFQNAGQSCIAAKRFIVEHSVADEFVERLTGHARALKLGDPLEDGTQMGPIAREDLRDELHAQVERSISEGAKLVLGGGPLAGPGAFYQPTILDHVTTDMAACREEIFGPVAPVIRVANVDDAIALANDTDYGLAAALWTSDIERANGLARRIEAGAVFINGMSASDVRLPFGGIKKSGYGRELGVYGIREFTNIKTVCVGAPPARSE